MSKRVNLEDLDRIGKEIALSENWMLPEEYQDFLDYLAEKHAEDAYVRSMEDRYDPEAQRDLELHEWLWPNGYGVD